MQSYQESQQRQQEQSQEPYQPPQEQPRGPSQPPEGTYQPPQQAYQQPQQPYQGAYPPQQAYQQPSAQPQQPYPAPQLYPGYMGPYPLAGRKDWLTTLLLCVFVGVFGVHRFYTGHILIGVIQLLTFGACGVWTIVDLIMIVTDNYKDANGLPLVKK